MSVRENIQFFHKFDIEHYLEILKTEHQAVEHPSQPNSYLIGKLPFYEPKWIEDHVSILGFNYAPLSFLLIDALVDRPELVPDEVLVCWTIEQEMLLDTTIGELRSTDLSS